MRLVVKRFKDKIFYYVQTRKGFLIDMKTQRLRQRGLTTYIFKALDISHMCLLKSWKIISPKENCEREGNDCRRRKVRMGLMEVSDCKA